MNSTNLKQIVCLATLAGITISAASCNEGWSTDYSNYFNGNGMQGGSSSGSSSGLMDFDVLSSFSVALNTDVITEQESIPTSEDNIDYNHYVENNFSTKNKTTLTFSGSDTPTVSGLVDGDTITTDGRGIIVRAHSKGLDLQVCGSTTNGYLKIYSEKKFRLDLNGVSITNPDGAAINVQEGNCFLVLTGSNSLSDGASATYAHTEDKDMKAVLFTEDDLRISGSGSLSVTACNTVGKSGISCDGEFFVRPNTSLQIEAGASAGHGIKANDAVIVKGGVQNIEVQGAGKKGLSSDGIVRIEGGRSTIITTGGVDTSDSSDPAGCAAIKSDSTLHIAGGELWLKSTGQGGKGISCNDTTYISGGDIYIITQGSQYGSSGNDFGGGPWGSTQSSSSNSVSPKGIRCDKNIYISGGNIYVRTNGSNGEGIESKALLSISGGNTAALAYDDGFNATNIQMTGGKALAVSSGSCDGLDSNGNLNVTGGVLIGVASTVGSEDGVDYENSCTISNATVIGLCSGGMGGGRISGHYISTTVSGSAGQYVALCQGSTPLVTFVLPRTYSSGELLLSAPSIASGSYTLKTGVTAQDGTLWMNYVDGCSSISGGSSTSVSAQ